VRDMAAGGGRHPRSVVNHAQQHVWSARAAVAHGVRPVDVLRGVVKQRPVRKSKVENPRRRCGVEAA